MSNADGSIHIVFNGEIYNYRELRERISDYQQTSETDTEVLLHLYEEYGVDCLEYLRGMFAFAIWDERRDRLFLARDRFGQKPLFYWTTDGSFLFGSTVRAILADEEVDAVPDLEAIRAFLTYQYVPHPMTGFEGIRRLAPGEYATISPDGISRERYWRLSHSGQSYAPPNKLATQLRDELREATRLRMRSDVPVGVFLSGGVDSTIVTALMSDLSDQAVETYSIGFDKYDELEYARSVAERYDTNHHEYMVTPDALDVLPEIIKHYEMPFGDPSAVPTYYVSQMASEDVTVALSGDAGDESFAGYDRYTWDRVATAASHVPGPVRQVIDTAASCAPEEILGSNFVRRIRRLLETASKDEVERYATYVCHMLGQEVNQVWNRSESTDELEFLQTAFDRADGPTRLDHIMNVDYQTYLPNDLLVKVDRASMAHSLESRSPFLDHKFASFAAKIPSKYKWRRGGKKWLLKRAFADEFPPEVRNRSKQGFSVPVDAWFREDLREFGRQNLNRLSDRRPFDATGLQLIFDEHISGRSDHGHKLWDLIILEQWYERFIDEI
jgi:asparagine synthase (glutamine-hydrolysing)